MTKPIEFPVTPEVVTPDWLSKILQSTGSITQARVKSLKREKVGEIDFTGQLVRFKLDYTLVEENTPTSLIVKFSNSDPETRNTFHQWGFYEKEVRFYQEFAPQSYLPTPQCYYGNIDLETGYSILILEDLGHLRTIDIETGCNLTQAELIIRYLAEFHAQWWDNPQLKTSSYIHPLDQIFKSTHEYFQKCWPKVPKNLEALLPEYQLPKAFLKFGDRFCQNSGDLFNSLSESPITLVHLDIHLDNLFLGGNENDESPIFFDWQTYGYGRAITDVTYFMIEALSSPPRKQEEKKLIQDYHSHLIQHGVEGYPFEQCWTEYKLAAFWKLMILTVGIMIDNPRPEMLPMLQMYIEHTLSRIIAFHEDHLLDEFL